MSKRFGSVLTNISGTANQILRVNSAGDGFEFFSPATLPAYTITNDSTDRAFDAVDTTIDELSNVVATLIKDITTLVGGPVAFQWSSSEQVYPFEKDSSGNTLYCKEVDFGALPNNGAKSVSHGISGFLGSKLFSYVINSYDASDQAVPLNYGDGSNYANSQIAAGSIYITCNSSVFFAGGFSAKVKLIYAK